MARPYTYRTRQSRLGAIKTKTGVLLATAVAGVVALGAPAVWSTTSEQVLRTATVRRAEFDTVIVAAGRVESTQSTQVKCTLERVTGAAAAILKLVDDGSDVKKGQVLCELDSSEFTELVRSQTITVDQAKAAYDQARLNLDVARLGLEAYSEGERTQADRDYRGQIALANSDMTRQIDRLGWTKRMKNKGYVSAGQVITEEIALKKAQQTLSLNRLAFKNFQQFSVRKAMKQLESEVIGAQATFDFAAIKKQREEEKLAQYQEMIRRCTIVAPHDGFLIHGNRAGKPPQVFEGAQVRQGMKLFDLPDLSKMEIVALLHETVVNRVKAGMLVRVRIEALPRAGEMTGEVSRVDSMPYNERKRDSNNGGDAAASEITYFLGRMDLDNQIEGLKPGMSAEIEILADRGPGVLSVPIEAVVREDDVDVCYVVHKDPSLPHERRAVTVGRSSHELVEIVSGLKAGEIVVLRAPKSTNGVVKRHLNGFGGAWDLSKFPPSRISEPTKKGGRGGFGGGGGFGGAGGAGGDRPRGQGKGQGKSQGRRGGGDPTAPLPEF
jgi:HlyD family secretion protein